MQKFINRPTAYVDEMLTGLVMAHPELMRIGPQGRTIVRRAGVRRGRVGIVTGGGAGHLPLFAGYVGAGFADSCAVGNIFEGPNMPACVDAMRAADGGAGILLLYGNYGGDRMNFTLAEQAAGIDRVETILANDDVASAPKGQSDKRRGVAGILFAYKAAGAMADAGGSIDDVTTIARDTMARTRTIGVGLRPCRIPGSTLDIVELPDDEIEFGMGIHGEPGLWRKKALQADAVVEEMIETLLDDIPDNTSGQVALLVNGLGATPLEEQYIGFRRAAELLTAKGLQISLALVGPFATSLEMAGVSISLCFMDEGIDNLMKAPASCPFWRVG